MTWLDKKKIWKVGDQLKYMARASHSSYMDRRNEAVYSSIMIVTKVLSTDLRESRCNQGCEQSWNYFQV